MMDVKRSVIEVLCLTKVLVLLLMFDLISTSQSVRIFPSILEIKEKLNRCLAQLVLSPGLFGSGLLVDDDDHPQ